MWWNHPQTLEFHAPWVSASIAPWSNYTLLEDAPHDSFHHDLPIDVAAQNFTPCGPTAMTVGKILSWPHDLQLSIAIAWSGLDPGLLAEAVRKKTSAADALLLLQPLLSCEALQFIHSISQSQVQHEVWKPLRMPSTTQSFTQPCKRCVFLMDVKTISDGFVNNIGYQWDSNDTYD